MHVFRNDNQASQIFFGDGQGIFFVTDMSVTYIVIITLTSVANSLSQINGTMTPFFVTQQKPSQFLFVTVICRHRLFETAQLVTNRKTLQNCHKRFFVTVFGYWRRFFARYKSSMFLQLHYIHFIPNYDSTIPFLNVRN